VVFERVPIREKTGAQRSVPPKKKQKQKSDPHLIDPLPPEADGDQQDHPIDCVFRVPPIAEGQAGGPGEAGRRHSVL